MKLVTAAQMRDLEQRAVGEGVSLDTLMENAGLAVAQEAWLSLGIVEGRQVLVIAGPGNNGGDALVAARHLAEWDADVTVYAPLGRPGGDEKLAMLRDGNISFIAGEGDVTPDAAAGALDACELVIDGLLGTGRSRAIEGALADVLRRLRAAQERPRPPKVIAIDLPTGVDADSGAVDALAVLADQTVTLGLAKPGLYTLPGAEHAGRVDVVDIGIPRALEAALALELMSSRDVRDRLPARPLDANKGTFGSVLIVAGSRQYVGAARLSAEACYRTGAGLVAVACVPALQAAVAPSLPEATYLLLDNDAALDDAAAARIIAALASHDVLLIGPGLGQGPGVGAAALRIIEAAHDLRACVIDADALNALAAAQTFDRLPQGRSVLTPHPGEMARLLQSDVPAVQANRLATAMGAAQRWNQVVVLKGAHTVVAAPDGRAALSPHATPLLATAGTGDVLAGAIAGFAAQGASPFDAAVCAVHAGGVATDELREEYGDRGMLASDLARALPSAIRTIREGKRAASAGFPGLSGLAGLADMPATGALP